MKNLADRTNSRKIAKDLNEKYNKLIIDAIGMQAEIKTDLDVFGETLFVLQFEQSKNHSLYGNKVGHINDLIYQI